MSRIDFDNLSYRTNESTLRNYFQRYGRVEKLVLDRDDQNQSLRRGFLIFNDGNAVNNVMFHRPHSIDQRQIFLRRHISTNSKSLCEALAAQLTVEEIFLTRLCSGETKEFFLNYFQRFGRIVDCRIFHSNHPRQMGYGFVRFDDYDSVDRVILSRPHRINSTLYHVRKSIPREYHYITSSIKPLSVRRPIWQHYAIGLINVRTGIITYPFQSTNKNDETKSTISSPEDDFEILATTASSLSSSISIVD